MGDAQIRGSDLDILGRLRNYVTILRHWTPAFPDRLVVCWREYKRLLEDAKARFAKRSDALKLLRQFGRRLDQAAANSLCMTHNTPLPPFDELHVCEPLLSLTDDLALGRASAKGQPKFVEATEDRKPLVGLQEDVWRLLQCTATRNRYGTPHCCRSGKEIADLLANEGTAANQNEKSISKIIGAMRRNGWPVVNRRGAGYYVSRESTAN
jgi:hypothetical protein